MRNKIITRFLSVILAVGLSATVFTTTAFAGGGDDAGEVIPTEPTREVVSEPAPAPKPLTPEGNMSLVDDIDGEASEDKQFITVVSKTGHYFYIIIDRAGDGENTVHFLNQVDEADLLALMEAEEEPPAVCTCSVKCEAGAVNTACPVCANNLNACGGKAPEPEEPEPPVKENKGGMGGLLVLLIVALTGGGGALYYFKFRKPKADVSGSTDLSEYDFDDEDEAEDEEMEE
ncbi:DUF4366 domain-containing protein [uncultured Phascolarctobacterium sp.]|uniref:DUF4366 domain-containing protein n=1 Tax=uncultured Phascolarctobacterium sp. TaxID=512296 RepID=UPI0026077A18|nr:DUF4366 domain-containing protein [uncultured Phascolarctobacterium sp.]